MKVNLVKEGHKVCINVSFPLFLNRVKVKKLLKEGYNLVGEEDAIIVNKLNLF